MWLPLEPGPWFGRAIIPESQAEEATVTFFKNDDNDLRQWLSGIREEVMLWGAKIDTLPDWATDDERVAKYLGLPAK